MAYIEFKPVKHQSIQATLNSNNNVKIVSKSAEKAIESAEFSISTADANLDTTFNSVSTSMVAENSFKGDTGIDQKYKYLRYAIDNETGNYLLLKNEVQNRCLYLYNKLGVELNHVSLPTELPNSNNITNKYLFINDTGTLIWKTCSPYGEEYYSGIAVNVDNNNKINVLYDQSYIMLTNDNKLTINIDALKEIFAQKSDLKISAEDDAIEW